MVSHAARRHASYAALLALTTASVALLTAQEAAAQDVHLYDWPHPDVPAAVVTDQGVLFLHSDGKPYRVYTTPKGTTLHVVDMDRDNKPDVVGLGKPTFMIGSDASPVWYQDKGCKVSLIADIVADNKLDIFCSPDGKELKVFTHDNQFVWSLNTGKAFKQCYAGDTNGDLKADIECSVGKKYLRADASGQLISADVDEPMVDQDKPSYTPYAAVADTVLVNKATFDMDQDGTAEEYVEIEDNLLVFKSKSKSKPLGMVEFKGKIQGVLVKSLTPKAAPSIIAVTDSELIVMSPDGKTQERFSLKLSGYKRQPLATFENLYANGFTDDAAAKEIVNASQQKLASCYAGELKKTQFAGSGKLLLQLKVSDKGLHTVEVVHSELAEKKVVTCAADTLKKLSFVKTPASGNSASINLTLRYTFRDQ